MKLHQEILEKTWNSGEENIRTLGKKELISRATPEEEFKSLGRRKNKNKNYVMLILHQVKLMTSNGFSISLILLEMNLEEIER